MKIRERRLSLSSIRHPEQPVCQLVFWTPTQETRTSGRHRLTCTDTLCYDTGLQLKELPIAMRDMDVWKIFLILF